MHSPNFPPWPCYEPDEIDAARVVLESGKVNYWTGNEGPSFESEFASYFGVKKSVALANGSLALECALHALSLNPGDEVVVTPRTFIASASSVVLQRLTPIFADVDRDSGNITAETVESALTSKTKAVIPVHLGGWPCEMAPIMALAKSRGIAVIEDCAQSHGAKLDGRYAGTFGDINAWSFCQDKIMTTGGEGGMLTTNDEELWSLAWSYKEHGKNYHVVHGEPREAGFQWLHESFGSNHRLTELQSAIGRRQLPKLSDWVQRRQQNAAILIERLKNISGLRIPTPREGISSAYYRLYAYIEPNALQAKYRRDDLIAEMKAQGVPLFSGSCGEVYLEKAFQNSPYAPRERLPGAKELGETSISFLTHPTLQDEHMYRMADVFVSCFNKLKR